MDRLDFDIRLWREEFLLAIEDSLDLTGISAVFGANGSGKTSLLRVLAGLEPAAHGTIRFRGRTWLGPEGSLKTESRAIGYVFQDGRLFSHLDVEGNLRFPLRHGGRDGPVTFESIVASFELERLLGRYPGALSGGERQRVAIARALLASPNILLMDEPLSALDVSRRQELLPLIRSLPARYGIPVIYVTHDVDELVYLADTVLLLANGQRIARGSAREILERGDFGQLAALDEPGVVLEARIAEQADGLTLISVPGGSLRIPRVAGESGEAVRLRVKPRDVILALEPPSGISIRNCLAASVREVDDRGDDRVLVSLSVGEQLLRARITRDAARELELTVGRSIYALIKTVALETY